VTARVLVVNAGSSSLKYRVVDPASAESAAAGMVERIAQSGGRVSHTEVGGTHTREVDCADHTAAFTVLREEFETHGPALADLGIGAVGHRVVHGGEEFSAPVALDDDVISAIQGLAALAPLHNPANVQGIAGAREVFAGLPHVAVFDTAFHATLPPGAREYAVPARWRQDFGVRKYGFHGTSHAYVSRRVAALLGRRPSEVNCIVLHLGNGASACAVAGGTSVDTSMGLSPTDGLVMGTRSGDLDPAVAGHLARVAGVSVEDFSDAVNTASGLLGMTGSSDFREVMDLMDAGNEAAATAYQVVLHRLVRHVGALAAPLGRLDAVAFTAGVGENNARLRADVLRRLSLLGLAVDEKANDSAAGEARISPPGAVAAFVVPTDEELEIARQCAELLGWP